MSESLKNWYNTAEGMALRKAASERFKILNPSKLVTPEQRKIAKEKYQKWLLTEDGLRRRKESSENMRKVQKLRYTGIYELIDPNGQTHITYNIINFCKEHSLSYHSFYFLLKNSKRKEPNKNGKNKGWIIVRWNVK